ncbi:conserved hypothetical protein [Candidatus Nitrotoga sp. HW29]|uniref:hypothetical protein n=1 Tax=Candidatus Nitrotoga sp. HW29 TaxID=2886963 RepID=UPI001EF2B687|nr:hypothetical protein [Candidatus Nitrotoga sp. HW29]CAH1905654.1 conserved hypothetical protein [Candidatus Nitrotoga sp. HW29]
MTFDNHALNLGKLVGNLHSLEFILRAFLQKLPDARPTGVAWGVDIYLFPIDTELAESELTSFDSLDDLIKKVNKKLSHQKMPAQIDRTLVELRDALAHGRVSTVVEGDPLRILKFSKPNHDGRVRITYNQVMSEEWFSEQRERVFQSIKIVANAIEAMESFKDPSKIDPLSLDE